MKQIENLMGVREGIRVVDATLRDGGLCNDYYTILIISIYC